MSSYSWSALPQREKFLLRRALIERDGYQCKKCGRKVLLTIDHVLSIHKGGPVMDLNNMQLLCMLCHARKTAAEQRHDNQNPIIRISKPQFSGYLPRR